MNHNEKGRIIGIRHRVKRTTEGEAHPTELYILDGDFLTTQKWLDTEDDELNFVRSEVKDGDCFATIFGGSGNSFVYALSRMGEKKGAKVYRIPAFNLKTERGEQGKEDDVKLLAKLFRDKPHLFYEVRSRDEALIEVVECYRARVEAMKARIACGNRLKSAFIGRLFRNPDGHYPEGQIEDLFDAEKANDKILEALMKEERLRERELTRAIEALDVYNEVFKSVEGCGMSIAAGIISAVGDIRRFETKAKFKAFLGVHVMSDGRFPRRRGGQVSNWSPSGRQALYLFGEQMNRRPKSVWGKKLREYKLRLREKHPEVVEVGGKKRYTDGHIHKMALWRTITKFAEWLYNEWWKLEGRGSEARAEAA